MIGSYNGNIPTTNLVLIFLMTIASCVGYYYWAKKRQIVDKPNERSSHTHTPVRGMGLALIPPLLLLIFLDPTLYNTGMIFGFLIAIITGYVDDRMDLKVYIRIPLYFLAIYFAFNSIIEMAGNYPLPLPGNQLGLNSIWGIVILYVFMMGLINAYNFMDGINGITGLYSLLFILTCVVISYYQGTLHTSSMLTFGTILSFLVVFGVFNYRSKALAFLGDSGSVFLGLFIGVYLLILNVTTASVNVVVLLAVYGVDSVLTIGLRLLKRENIFKAHRSHLYQDLVHVKKWSHIQVAMAYVGVQLLINFIVFVPIINKSLSTALVLSILALLSTIYLWAKYQMKTLTVKRLPNE